MGIFLNLSISKSITRQEWEPVYEETLRLAQIFSAKYLELVPENTIYGALLILVIVVTIY